MQKRHSDRQQYFDEQGYTTLKYVIPFIESHKPVTPESTVLEIGCGEGGNIKPFLDLGCTVTGVDISEGQIEMAKALFENHPNKSRLTLISEDIYNVTGLNRQFDIIILRDVIEHIPNQERFMSFLKRFMKPDGVVFFGFPPWQNPFGGHQQVCSNAFLSHLPWLHLLPHSIYGQLLRWGGVDPRGLLEIKETGISLERFRSIIKKENYDILFETLYLINPNYEIKFGFRPRKLRPIFNIPYLRNFYTTCGYYLIKLRT
ncbi:MAG: class I SAM-dependent methyltransferase [Tannerellaceae bacterium]|jgi:SAM-dependent methyltransferase|nr:class I SAM-dependent methyltransferase [Tannerellaceae bacterium]